jgi:hypothetical protein
VSVSIDTTSQNRNDKIRRNNIVATSIFGSIIKLLTTDLVQIVLASYMLALLNLNAIDASRNIFNIE